MLALKELLGNKLRSSLIALAIGLVVALTFLMSAMSEGLVTGMTGAKVNLDADVLVFQRSTGLALERSLLTDADLELIRGTPGVEDVYPVGHAMVSVDTDDGGFDARVFGLGGRFDQLPIVEGPGGPPGPGEAIVDESARNEGVAVGDTVRLSPVERSLTVVGFTRDRRYVMAPTFYVDMATWEDIYLASALARTTGPEAGAGGAAGATGADTAGGAVPTEVRDGFAGSASIAAVSLGGSAEGDAGEEAVATLSAALGDRFEVATPREAAMAGNGMSAMVLAVDGIQVVSLIIGALVIGVFFYITTMHKAGQIAAIKALGASNGYVCGQLLLQVGVLVTVAAAIGLALAVGAGSSMPPTMAFDPEPSGWILSLLAVYAMTMLGSLFSLRAILRIDPATALDQGEH